MPPSEASVATSADGMIEESADASQADADPRGRILTREQHSISRKHINANALKVLYRLHKGGYQAHLVGGGVRDLLLGRQPKDFDVATDATPEQVRDLFRNCRLIGRRFRLAHVVFGRDVVEVATFRADHDAVEDTEGDLERGADGRIVRDNVFGTIEEDAYRRDFTVNALYYDISRFAVIDYTGALADLEARRLRLIGDPRQRYREDPVRMLRAARFAAKLGFDIDARTAAPIDDCGPMLRDIPPSRLFDEVLKLFITGHARASLEHLLRLDLLQYLFPGADAALKAGDEAFTALLEAALDNTDRRLAADKPVTPAFLYAVLLWPVASARAATYREDGESAVMAMQRGGAEAADEQQAYTALPKRFAQPMRDIWLLQPKLAHNRGKRARLLLDHPRLRAAWDFLCLRRDAGEDLDAICDWWQRAMDAHAQGEALPAELHPTGGQAQGKRRRRGGRRHRRGGRGDS
jgi:poly(A) polymerase